MKILFLCWRDLNHPLGGGSEKYLVETAKHLTAEGHEILWYTACYPGAETHSYQNNIQYFRKGNRLTVYPWAWWYLLLGKFHRGPIGKFKPTAIIDTQNGIPFFARIFFPQQTILLVHHTHTNQWQVAGKILGKIGNFLETKISPRMHRKTPYLTVSSASATDLINLGVAKQNLTIAHAGLTPLQKAFVQPPAQHPQLCVLSRLVPHKQIEHAIRATQELLSEYPDLTLEIMGDGWWKKELTTLTEQLGITQQVTFHGQVGEPTKTQILSQSWIHLLPSLKEGWGISVMEAAQVGVPSIGYQQAGGLNDSIQDQKTGLLVANYPELVAAVKNLLNDATKRHQLGKNAQAFASQFHWENTAKQIMDLINQR